MSILATEDAILARLREVATPAKLRVDSLPGDWDDDMLKRLRALAPALLVAFPGGAPDDVGEVEPQIVGEWEVYVVTAQPSGQDARRRGNAQGLGAYEIIERLVIPALHNFEVPEVGTLQLARVANLFTGAVEQQGLAVYGVVFRLPMPMNVAAAVAGLDDFITFAAQLDVPAHAPAATQQAWLVGDYSGGEPDAKDTVVLPAP